MLCVNCELVGICLIALTFQRFALVLKAGGIRMAKAGNRSISSKSGSADVLSFEINVSASPELRHLMKLVWPYLCPNHAPSHVFYRSCSKPSTWDSNDYELGRPNYNPLTLRHNLWASTVWNWHCYYIQQLGRKRAVITTGPDNMPLNSTPTPFWKMVTSVSTLSLKKIWYERLSCLILTGGDAKLFLILLSVLKTKPALILKQQCLMQVLGFCRR